MIVAIAVLATVAILYLRGPADPSPQQRPSSSEAAASAGYADPESCAVCHDQIARTYGLTGMGRSFARVRPGQPHLAAAATLHHVPSDRHYTMVERDGRFYQRRHELGFDGKPTSVLELEAHYVVGSGNHARTFIHRKSDGRLVQLPVSWYAERGGFWAMSPGYDRPAHMDFRRLIPEDCMSCHNGYPRAPVRDDGNGVKYDEPIPEGIDCQRCHGPGQAHIDAIKANNLETGRRAIINPATLDRARQLETCMQCHLETTSSPLPFQIRRYEHPRFSFTPGNALADYVIHFDHAPRTGHDDKFEIAGAAYRLRKSACFQRSEMTCTTCHDPHDIPRGAAAIRRYVEVCQSCHQEAHANGPPRVSGAGARATCLDCHMPKRRTEDAVHVVMTDHFIQRRRPAGDLLAPKTEPVNPDQRDYRGEVVLYYPETLPAAPASELYLALAQVQHGSNLTAGIPRFEQALARYQPDGADFYYELARAYSKTSNHEAVIRWCEEALRRNSSFAPALKELAGAATALGRFTQAAGALEKAVAFRPGDSDALADLGNVYLQQGRVAEAQGTLDRALATDPTMPRAHNTMGLAALNQGDSARAERHFREALTHQPDLAEARNNLGNLLASRRLYAEAGHEFEKAVKSDPNYVEARHSYGLVLALAGDHAGAVAQLQAAARLAPRLAQVHTDLGDVFAAMGRVADAAREYQLSLQLDPNGHDARAGLDALRDVKR